MVVYVVNTCHHLQVSPVRMSTTPTPRTVQVPSSDVDIFKQAQETFLNSLSENERGQFSRCTSAPELLKDVQAFCAFKNSRKNWTESMTKVKKFSDHLQPYFEIANIVLQTNLEWTTVAWGALRLILKVSRLICHADTPIPLTSPNMILASQQFRILLR